MAHIVLDCPHCEAQQMTMKVHHRAATREGLGIAYAQCGACSLPVVAVVTVTGKSQVRDIQTWIGAGTDVIRDTGLEVVFVIPDTKESSAPEHIPTGTSRVFVQAQNARKRGDRDTAGMAFRKTLDIALKAFDSSLKGDLFTRIDALAASHAITPAMKDWAHQVRLIGNDAAHEDDEPSEQEIEAIALFTETLLKYLFTLPAEVSARTAATATPQSGGSGTT